MPGPSIEIVTPVARAIDHSKWICVGSGVTLQSTVSGAVKLLILAGAGVGLGVGVGRFVGLGVRVAVAEGDGTVVEGRGSVGASVGSKLAPREVPGNAV